MGVGEPPEDKIYKYSIILYVVACVVPLHSIPEGSTNHIIYNTIVFNAEKILDKNPAIGQPIVV